MVEISNVQVYDLEESVIASGNAMRTEPVKDVTYEEFHRGLERCKKLAQLGGGTGHSNFRTGIRVSFDIKYTQYFTKQLQRYHFLDIVSSSSLMHKISKMDFQNCTNKYVSDKVKQMMQYFVVTYNMLCKGKMEISERTLSISNYKILLDMYYSEDEIPDLDSMSMDEIIYDCYMRIISNCPMGTELFMRVSTNYEQLATIYKQRRFHKLKEDWGEFCKFIEGLPYAKELILC